jgi:hypothetical protein
MLVHSFTATDIIPCLQLEKVSGREHEVDDDEKPLDFRHSSGAGRSHARSL